MIPSPRGVALPAAAAFPKVGSPARAHWSLGSKGFQGTDPAVHILPLDGRRQYAVDLGSGEAGWGSEKSP